MELIDTGFDGLKVLKTKIHGDERGFFMESFNSHVLAKCGIEFQVEQINFAKSQANVLRGLHYQQGEFAQAKIVGCITGSVKDVVVDIRKQSTTYLDHFEIVLNSPDTLLVIPRGFAHGYYTLKDDTIFYYAVNNLYHPEAEGGLRYDDPNIGIDWGFNDPPLVSEKDLKFRFI